MVARGLFLDALLHVLQLGVMLPWLLWSATDICGSPKFMIDREPALPQVTLPRDHVVNNKLPYFMQSKPPILMPQQVLCPIVECRACCWTVNEEITPFIQKQTRKCDCEEIRCRLKSGHRQVSNTAVVSMVSHGITVLSIFCFNLLCLVTTSFMAALTCAFEFVRGSGRMVLKT